jgi:tetratricopeptide (TPR) repeat protein
LRLQRYGEALTAYDAALAQRQKFPGSLYGRGIVKRHLGRQRDAEADIQAAIRMDPNVASEFAAYGIK